MTRRLTGLEVLVAAGAVLAGLLDQPSLEEQPTAWRLLAVWAVVSFAAGLFWRRRPVLACVGTLAALAFAELAASGLEVELTFLTQLPLAVALYGLGSTARTRTTLVTVAGIAGVIGVGFLVNGLTAAPEWRGGTDVAAAMLPLVLALAAGLTVRNLRLASEAAQERLAAERRERLVAEEHATAEERRRIAREMHDVVAHSVTLLVVHAEAMRARGAELPDWARQQADAMAADGRRAAEEMRELLAVLDDTGSAPREPAPRVEHLPVLVESSRATGARIEYAEHGDPVALSRQAELVAFRVVQESITNAHRHAFGAPIAITQSWAADGLRLAVESGLGAEVLLTSGTGAGLSGLRGRVEELGGSVELSRTDDGRHRVVAFLPANGAHP